MVQDRGMYLSSISQVKKVFLICQQFINETNSPSFRGIFNTFFSNLKNGTEFHFCSLLNLKNGTKKMCKFGL